MNKEINKLDETEFPLLFAVLPEFGDIATRLFGYSHLMQFGLRSVTMHYKDTRCKKPEISRQFGGYFFRQLEYNIQKITKWDGHRSPEG